jgi:hypothetical protein
LRATSPGNLARGKADRRRRQREDSPYGEAHAPTVNVHASDPRFADDAGLGQTFQPFVPDEAHIHAVECIQKTLGDLSHPQNVFRKAAQSASEGRLGSVMNHDFNAEYTFAFAVDLQAQLSVVDVKNRQIIDRCLDFDSPLILLQTHQMGTLF